MQEKVITKIDALPQLQRKLKVCAYARVSSGKDAMLHSLSAQVSYYNSLIQSTDGWEFVGIYADEAISGTKDTREEFNRIFKTYGEYENILKKHNKTKCYKLKMYSTKKQLLKNNNLRQKFQVANASKIQTQMYPDVSHMCRRCAPMR